MQTGLRLCFLLIVLYCPVRSELHAVIISVGEGLGNTNAPLDDPGWANVGTYGDFSAVYLGNRWAIAANHVERAPAITFTGISIPVESGSEIPLRNPDVSELSDDALILVEDGVDVTEFTDLRLIRLAEDPGLPELTISSSTPPFLDEPIDVIMIGQGRDRAPDRTLWVVNDAGGGDHAWDEVDEAPFNVSGFKYGDTQTMRWGTNTIVADALAQFDDADVYSLATQFNRDRTLATEFEAQATRGDSGGGVFYKNDGNWELTGLMFSVGNLISDQPPETAVFGNVTLMANLSIYRDQIEQLTSVQLEAGDANQDLSFDQHDIIQVLKAAKYLTGLPATWGEGDWNEAPGGTQGAPPVGDNVFDQRDIVAALASGLYLSGPHDAKSSKVLPIGLGDWSLPTSLSETEKLVDAGSSSVYVPVPEPSTMLLALSAFVIGLCALRACISKTRRNGLNHGVTEDTEHRPTPNSRVDKSCGLGKEKHNRREFDIRSTL